MNKKKIIKKLEAVVCELKEEKEEYAELLDDYDEWVECYTKAINIKCKGIEVTTTCNYTYFKDATTPILFRVKR